MHDPTVNRTTSGEGPVGELTLSELRELDAGEGEKIPLLEEVLDFVKDRIGLMLDLADPGFEELLLEKAHEFRLLDNLIISGANEPLVKIKGLEPKIRIAPSFSKVNTDALKKAHLNESGDIQLSV